MNAIETDRLTIEPVNVGHAAELLDIYLHNREHLGPWEPKREDSFYTLETHVQQCENAQETRTRGSGYPFVIRLISSNEMIGRVNLNNVVRGVFQNAYLGYFIAERYNGKGYMTEAVSAIVAHAFHELELHRLQAAVITDNHGSIRVLEKCGFRREGHASNYLKINDSWRDHYLYAITVEDMK